MATPESSALAHPSTRELRGLQLFRERGAEIVRTAPYTYEVPACTGEHVYTVVYGGREESCSCPDWQYRGAVCKHVYAIVLWRAKAGECASCNAHQLRRHMFEAGEEHAVFYAGELLCRSCAGKHGVR